MEKTKQEKKKDKLENEKHMAEIEAKYRALAKNRRLGKKKKSGG